MSTTNKNIVNIKPMPEPMPQPVEIEIPPRNPDDPCGTSPLPKPEKPRVTTVPRQKVPVNPRAQNKKSNTLKK